MPATLAGQISGMAGAGQSHRRQMWGRRVRPPVDLPEGYHTADGGNPGDLVGPDLMLRDLRVAILNRSERGPPVVDGGQPALLGSIASPLSRPASPRRCGPSTCAAC